VELLQVVAVHLFHLPQQAESLHLDQEALAFHQVDQTQALHQQVVR
jgi:hypothetical protein